MIESGIGCLWRVLSKIGYNLMLETIKIIEIYKQTKEKQNEYI
jgi:hypothetical protein